MKIYKIINIIMLAIFISVTLACEENEEVAKYSIVGDAYATVVDFTVSNDKPTYGETVQVNLSYVNYKEDPITSITFYEKVNDGERTLLMTVDESDQPLDEEIEQSFDYVVPVGVEGAIYVELQSTKEFPQVEMLAFEIYEDIPTIVIDDIINNLPFDGVVFEGGELGYVLDINDNEGILYRDLSKLSHFYSINGSAEVPGGTLELSGTSDSLAYFAMIPEGSEGQAVTFRFEVETVDGVTMDITSDPVNVDVPLALAILSDESVSLNATDTIAYDFVNLTNVATAGDPAEKDIRISAVGSQVTMESANGTIFYKTTEDMYATASLNAITYWFNAGEATSMIDVTVGDIYIAKLRGQDDYVIFKITDRSLIGDNETVITFDIKY